MTFHWNWFSQTGSAREQNQDYAGIAVRGDYLFAVIADGVFSRAGSGDFARYLVRSLTDQAMEARLPTESDDVTRWIETAFQQLKEARSPKKSVSFLVAAFKRSQLLFTVHAGDCRAGVKHEAGPSWKTTVHSLATALQSVTEAELVAHPLRNQLTRVFNNKRYCEPEITELQCECVGGAILVTDGYWAGLPKEDQRINFTSGWQTDAVCDDDVSRLFIEWRSGEPAMRHESHNLYLRDG